MKKNLCNLCKRQKQNVTKAKQNKKTRNKIIRSNRNIKISHYWVSFGFPEQKIIDRNHYTQKLSVFISFA